MKKLFVAILATLYMGTTVGATLHLHYCMDKVVGWDLLARIRDHCSNCGMSKQKNNQTKDCCKDEQKQFKLKIDHVTTENVQLLPTFHETGLHFFIELPAIDIRAVTGINPSVHAPPLKAKTPLHILNSVFLI